MKNLGGRPVKNLNREQFENLCAIQCSLLEIANFFDVDKDTVNAWCKREYGKGFSEVFNLKRTKGFTSLRHRQFQLAEKNVAMAIFLGKNYLGQSDKMELSGSQEIRHSYNLETLSEEELLTLRGILTKANGTTNNSRDRRTAGEDKTEEITSSTK